jgi:hypothetical protein
MRSNFIRLASVSLSLSALLVGATASAQDAPAEPADPAVDAAAKAAEPAAAPAAAPAPAAPADASGGEDKDGVRFRGGVSGGVGGEIVTGGTAIMGGVDGRLGVQINDLIGVYAQPHLSFGSFGGALGFTGTFTTTAVADFTFIDQLFVGGGAGFGLFNNPTGPVVHLRAGGYPLMGHGENGVRRKGLMVSFDMRLGFITGDTVIYPMGSIGYEAF